MHPASVHARHDTRSEAPLREAPALNVSGHVHDKPHGQRGFAATAVSPRTPEQDATPFGSTHCGVFRVHPRLIGRWRLVVEILAGRQMPQPESERWAS